MMKKLGLALLLCLGLAPAQAQQLGPSSAFCDKSFIVSAAAATSIVFFVQPDPARRVYICGVALNAGAAAATFQLTGGTGTNCNANTVALTPLWSLGINGVFVNRTNQVGESTALGSGACYTITGTGPLSAQIYYAQF